MPYRVEQGNSTEIVGAILANRYVRWLKPGEKITIECINEDN